MAIGVATFSGMPPEFTDDRRLLAKLKQRGVEVVYAPWDDPRIDWNSLELVVNRTPWDYALRHHEYVAWVEGLRVPIENAASLIVWNSDKRYLADLEADGVPVVPTSYVEPGWPIPEITGEVVIKPAISGGARDTGRFGPSSADAGRALIERICGSGGTAMVQPFITTVDTAGETAIVMIDGRPSHVLRKRAVLRSDEVAPVRDDDLAVAEAMYDPDLVVAGEAAPEEFALARQVIGAVRERFGVTPLCARVDMLRDGSGTPVLLELEAIEPNLYFDQTDGAADRLAAAIAARLRA